MVLTIVKHYQLNLNLCHPTAVLPCCPCDVFCCPFAWLDRISAVIQSSGKILCIYICLLYIFIMQINIGTQRYTYLYNCHFFRIQPCLGSSVKVQHWSPTIVVARYAVGPHWPANVIWQICTGSGCGPGRIILPKSPKCSKRPTDH